MATFKITRKLAIGERMNQVRRSIGWEMVGLNDRTSDLQFEAELTVEAFYASETVGSGWSGYQKMVVDFRIVEVQTTLGWSWAEESIVTPSLRQWAGSDTGYSALYEAFKASPAAAELKAEKEAAESARKAEEEEAARKEEEEYAPIKAQMDAARASAQEFFDALKQYAIKPHEVGDDYVRVIFHSCGGDVLFFRTVDDATRLPPQDDTRYDVYQSGNLVNRFFA